MAEETAAAGSAAATESKAAPDPKVEAEAREMGWVPESEWKGEPDQWRDAGEFVKRGQEFLPIVRSQLKKERERSAALERQVAEMRDDFDQRIQRLDKTNRIALDAQRKQLEDRFEAEKRKAVEASDTAAYDDANKRQKAALEALDDKAAKIEAEEEKRDTGRAAPDKAAVSAWIKENGWYSKSRRLRAAADDYFDALEEEMPGAPVKERLAEVLKRMEAEFPKQFGKPDKRDDDNEGDDPAPARSRVESGSRTPGGGNGRALSRIPKADLAIGERHVKEGLFKDINEWAKAYLEQA